MMPMEIFAESSVQQEKFRTAANKLLNACFIVKKKEETRNDYVFILQHRQMFGEYFGLLGYQVEINEGHGVIALVNVNGTGRLRLKKIESILLLVLRLLYLEKRKELSLVDDVIVLTDEIQQKYSMLKIGPKAKLDKTTLRDVIRLFRRYNLITPLDRDVTLSDARIKIYPSILFAVPNDNLNSMYEKVTEKLNQYATGGESGDDEDADQD
jgi:hypothetical protein